MALIYKPLRQYMVPCDTVIDPKKANENVFSLVVDGQICTAYRFVVYDLRGNVNSDLSTELVSLDAPLYAGDKLEHSVPVNSFTAGETYRWQMCLLASKMNVVSVDADAKTYKVSNHNLHTGDSIFVFSTGELPTELTAWKMYYIRRVDKDNIALYEYIDGAKNDAGRVEVTSPASGSLSVYNGVQSEVAVFDVYDSPTLSISSATITGHEYTWKPTYNHPQGVMVNHWEAFISNPEDQTDTGTLRSGDIYSSKIEWTYSGLMSGINYLVWFKIVTNVGQIYYSAPVSFPVSYSDVSVGMSPTATNDEDDSNVLVKWSPLIENIGEIKGDYSFVDYLDKPNKGIYLHSGAELSYGELEVEQDNSSVPMFMWTPKSSDFNGVIMKAENTFTAETLEIGYDSSVHRFWFSINDGERFGNIAQEIHPNMAYLIGIAGDALVVNIVGNVEVKWDE